MEKLEKDLENANTRLLRLEAAINAALFLAKCDMIPAGRVICQMALVLTNAAHGKDEWIAGHGSSRPEKDITKDGRE